MPLIRIFIRTGPCDGYDLSMPSARIRITTSRPNQLGKTKTKYQLLYREGGRDTPERSGGIFTTQKEVDEARRQILEQLERGVQPDIKALNKSLGHFAPQYFQRLVYAKLAPNTKAEKEKNYRLYVEPEFGRRPLKLIDRAAVDEFEFRMAEKGLGPSVTRKCVTLLKELLNLAYKVSRLNDRLNPAANRDRSNLPSEQSTRREPESLTQAEVEALAEAISIPRDRVGPGVKNPGLREAILKLMAEGKSQYAVAKELGVGSSTVHYHVHRDPAQPVLDRYEDLGFLVRFAAYTGLRIGEIAALRPMDIDLETDNVSVNGSITTYTAKTVATYNLPGRVSRELPKSKKVRPTPVPDFLREDLVALMARRKPDEHLFQMPGGGRIDSTNFNARFLRPAAAAIGKPGFTFHGYRHTFVSLLLANGAPVLTVSKMAGHASAKVTLDTYGHVMPGHDHEALAKLTANRPQSDDKSSRIQS